ncbi:uncharacterized protein LOC135148313 [Daucus carota subsp. sativus]|uniref:uncharacterized protein LOC135148313 n=1 Tax=Daucus carota subsp. sativus TaxID=79200 RepID=UPI0030837941
MHLYYRSEELVKTSRSVLVIEYGGAGGGGDSGGGGGGHGGGGVMDEAEVGLRWRRQRSRWRYGRDEGGGESYSTTNSLILISLNSTTNITKFYISISTFVIPPPSQPRLYHTSTSAISTPPPPPCHRPSISTTPTISTIVIITTKIYNKYKSGDFH